VADATFYQIFPERFANGDSSLDPDDVVPWDSEPTPDNFFGGDLQGIIDHLDHLESLGVNALYLTPIFEADTNHRYDAKDYFKIDGRLGDLAAFQRLVEAAHARGLRVILDAVFNHSGDGHPAFRDVVENEERSKYVNWYSFEGFPVRSQPEPNYRTCSGCHYLPKWNVYNPEVRAHHYDVAKYWIAQGIDGWRLDVPYFINHEFWRGFRDTVKNLGDDLYIVAEEWRAPEEWLQGDIADGTMNYTFRDVVLAFTADKTIDAYGLAKGMNDLRDRIPGGFHKGMLNLLGSHDTERVLTRHNGVVEDLMLAYALMFTSEGAPMIYYGDEIGMLGQNDPGCRGGMQWEVAKWSQPISEGVRALSEARANTVSLRRGTQEYRAIDSDTVSVIRTIRNERTVAVIHRGSGRIVRREEIPLDHQHGARVIAGRSSTADGVYEVDKSNVLIVTGTPNGA
jgi:glycosidase